MKAFLLKVDSALYIQWTEAAKAMGLSVSEWIRRQCSIPGSTQEFEALKRAEDRPTENSSRAARLPVAERSARITPRTPTALERAEAKRASATGIKLCRHQLSDCTICGVSAKFGLGS